MDTIMLILVLAYWIWLQFSNYEKVEQNEELYMDKKAKNNKRRNL